MLVNNRARMRHMMMQPQEDVRISSPLEWVADRTSIVDHGASPLPRPRTASPAIVTFKVHDIGTSDGEEHPLEVIGGSKTTCECCRLAESVEMAVKSRMQSPRSERR